MSYYYAKTLRMQFDEAVDRVTQVLADEGFGIMTDINVKEALKEKLFVDFRNYRILGACNPRYAYEALQLEDRIGVMLPCSVIVQEKSDGWVEVAAIDPLTAMQVVGNPALSDLAKQVSAGLRRAIDSL